MKLKRCTALIVLASLITASPCWSATRSSSSIKVRLRVPERLEFTSAKMSASVKTPVSSMDLSMEGQKVDYKGSYNNIAVDLGESIVRSATGYRKTITMTAL